MNFLNKSHKQRFIREAKKLHPSNNSNMAALFLLTANGKLWSIAKHHIQDSVINIKNIKLSESGDQKAYTLLAIAKDLTLGTNYVQLRDLGDTSIISPKLLCITFAAISIKRNGIDQNLI